MSTLELFTCYWFIPSLCLFLLIIQLDRLDELTPEDVSGRSWKAGFLLSFLWPLGALAMCIYVVGHYSLGHRLWTALTKERGGKK